MSTIQITITKAAFNNKRELIKKVTHDLSDVVGLTLVEVSYGIDGLGMKFDNPEGSEKHELGQCWCGIYHFTGDSPSNPPKPIGPPLKDMREGSIPKYSAKRNKNV